MFKTKFFSVLTLAVCVSIFASSCKKDEPKPEKEQTNETSSEVENKEITKDVKDYGKWYYYSFDKGDFVGEGSANPEDGDDAKWKEKKDWDIAFHRNNVRTNGGTSGGGKAEVLKLETEDFDAVKEVPAGDFTVDSEFEKFMFEFKMPPNYVKSNLNSVANNWAAFEHSTMSWSIHKKVFIVKTAEGKFVKLQFLNFLDDKDKGGLLHLKYSYQKNGSKNFE